MSPREQHRAETGRRELRDRKLDRFFHVSKLAWMQQLEPPPALPVPMLEKKGVTFDRRNGYREVVRDNGDRVRVSLN